MNYDTWKTTPPDYYWEDQAEPDFDEELDAESEDEFYQLWASLPDPEDVEPVEILVPCPSCWENCGYVAYGRPLWDDPYNVEVSSTPCGCCHGTGSVPADKIDYPDERDDDYLDPGYLNALEHRA